MARPPYIVTTRMPALAPGLDRQRVAALASAIRKLRLEIETTIERDNMIAETIESAIEQAGKECTAVVIGALTEVKHGS